MQLSYLNRSNQIEKKTGALVCTVEVELQPVCIDVVQGNAQLGGYVLHDAAEASGDEEHLDVALVQTVHELPAKKKKCTDRLTSCVYVDTNQPNEGPIRLKKVSCKHVDPIHSKRHFIPKERWFMTITILNGVPVHTRSDPVSWSG